MTISSIVFGMKPVGKQFIDIAGNAREEYKTSETLTMEDTDGHGSMS